MHLTYRDQDPVIVQPPTEHLGRAARPILAPSDPAAGRRLILISYHFPPGSAVGALRWQKLARFAHMQGWGLDVITLDPDQLTDRAPERLHDLPETTSVYGISHRRRLADRIEALLLSLRSAVQPSLRRSATRPGSAEPQAGARTQPIQGSVASRDINWWPPNKQLFRRSYFITMDILRMRAWTLDAFRLARRLYVPGVHRAIITCGPPHLPHEAGRRLSRATGLPHVVDMRDPWSLLERIIEPLASPLFFTYHSWFEKRVIRNAALVVSNTQPARDALTKLYPETASRQITVVNGYDEESVQPRKPEKFLIVYAGSIYLDRDPRPFFRAAASAIRQLGVTPEEFAIQFIGNVATLDGQSIQSMADEAGLAGYFTAERSKPRARVLESLASASILLSLPQDCELAIPSKIYEYMLFPAWILALAEPASATGQLLAGRPADVLSHTDVEGITAAIRRRYLQYESGVRPPRLADDKSLGRAAQADRFFSELDRRIGAGRFAAGVGVL